MLTHLTHSRFPRLDMQRLDLLRHSVPPSHDAAFGQHHSITSSALIMTSSGIVKPEALAVLRLTTSSNLVGCSTGISAGFSPLRMRSTISAPRRHSAPWSVP